MSDTSLFAQQRANRRRSIALVVAFLAFFAWIGFGGDLALFLQTADAPAGSYRHGFPWIGILASTIGVGMAWYGWTRGPKEVLWATGAWELVTPATPAETLLVNVVEEMAIASGLPRPTIWIVPEPDPNAFATGTDERHAHIAVTEGLLAALSRDQLQAVVAHELAHVRNHDMKLMTLLAALVGTIALISDSAGRLLRGGGGRLASRGRSSGKKGSAGKLAIIILVVWLITLILAPIISRLLALAVSRKREFLADASAAQFTRNPAALAEALRAIEDHADPTRAIGRGTAHLCIADPLGRRLTNRQGFVADFLATHPPMALRISRLRQMAYQLDRTGAIPEAT